MNNRKEMSKGQHLAKESVENKGAKKSGRGWWILGGVLLLLGLLVVAGILFANSKLDKLNYDDGKIELEKPVEEVRQELLEETGIDAASLGTVEEIEMADLDIIDEAGIINILLLGTDERDFEFSDRARADAIMLLSLDLNKHTIKLVSIERGLTMPFSVEGYSGVDTITNCFNYGGADLTMRQIEDCLRVQVDRYVRVNLNAFIKVIDVLGGVDIELTEREANHLNELIKNTNGKSSHLYYGDNERDFRADLVEGKNHLNGPMALAYARLRSIDSNWYRIVRQRNVITSCLNSLRNANINTLNNLCDEILPLVKTNFTKKEIAQLMLQVPNFISADVEQMTIPAKGTFDKKVGAGGMNIYAPIFQDNAVILQEFFYGEVRTPVDVPK